jgi:Rieske 2Fe-2S family protein
MDRGGRSGGGVARRLSREFRNSQPCPVDQSQIVTRDTDMHATNEMLTALQARRPGFGLDQRFYVDPEFYRLDLETIFYREWLFVGHDCELRLPGDYLTLQVGAYPVIVVRSRDGLVRAFHNSCRHRGSRICSAEKGSAVRLVCPYHNWSYDLESRLLFARDMRQGVDPKTLGLKPVHCQSIAGYVWICLFHEPPDISPLRAMMEPYFLPHRLSEARVAYESTIIENGNWKLVWENNRECYHCSPNHPELCRTFPEAPTVSGVRGAMDDPFIADHWERLEKIGLRSKFALSSDGQSRASRVPLMRDAVSYTLSGKAAVRRPLSDDIAEPNVGALLLFNYPTTWNHVMGDHGVTFRVLPLGPLHTQVTTKWLVHKDAVEGVDYSIDELTFVWTATNDQDRRIVEENQRGICSPAYEPGPYNPLHEDGVMQFVDWYCGAIERTLGGRIEGLSRVA